VLHLEEHLHQIAFLHAVLRLSQALLKVFKSRGMFN
jgi:hypothetical protein